MGSLGNLPCFELCTAIIIPNRYVLLDAVLDLFTCKQEIRNPVVGPTYLCMSNLGRSSIVIDLNIHA